jgi:hypothetical protein
MLSVEPILLAWDRPALRHIFTAVLFSSLVVLSIAPDAWAQVQGNAGQSAVPLVKPSAPLPAAKRSGPQWQELSSAQKQALRPLAATWDSLSGTHKIKWIALAQSYPSKTPAEQEKMQGRMAEWAALTPSDRERARLNFAESKKVGPTEKAAEWEAYQGLSAQEKKDLAAKGNGKPAGAAVAVTPLPPSKLTAVPVTRHTSQQEGATPVPRPKIDPKTLLPRPLVPAVSAPVTGVSAPQQAASSAN